MLANGASATIAGDGNKIAASSNVTAIVNGQNDSACTTGTGSWSEVDANNSVVLATGLGDTASATGNQSRAETDGASSLAWTSCNGDVADVKRANSSACISSANFTAKADGANGTFNVARDFVGNHIADQTERNYVYASGNRVDDLKDFTKTLLKDETRRDETLTTTTTTTTDLKTTTVQTDDNGDGLHENTVLTLDVNLDGKADKVTTITLNTDCTQASTNGSGNTVKAGNNALSLGSGGVIAANGTGESINAPSNSISFGAASSGTVSGNYDAISGGGHNTLTITGFTICSAPAPSTPT